MSKVLVKFVRCDRCWAKGKPASIYMPPNYYGPQWVKRLPLNHKVRRVLFHFISGVRNGIPLCCVIYFCRRHIKGERVAYVTALERGEEWPKPYITHSQHASEE